MAKYTITNLLNQSQLSISGATETSPLVGVNGIARKLTDGYIGVNGVARRIIAGYVGVNGAAKIIWKRSGIEDGTLSIYANIVKYDEHASGDSYNIVYSGSKAITIDWGDGTIETPQSNYPSHRYPFSGRVIIKVKYNDDTIFESYEKQSDAFFLHIYYSQSESKWLLDNTAMTKIVAPDMKIFGGYAFRNATWLTSIETRLPIEINELHQEIFTTSLQDEPREVHIVNGALQYKDSTTSGAYFGDNSFVPVFEGIITVSGSPTVDCYRLYSMSKKLTDIVIKFNFGDEISVPSQMSGLFTQSLLSKYTQTYIVYTDNETIHDFAIAKNNEYTIYTVKHLDGSDW